MTHFHISAFYLHGWRRVGIRVRELFERCSLQIKSASQQKKKKESAPLFKLLSVYLPQWFCPASPRHVARWHLRSGFTSSISEYNKFWTKEELTGHYCVAP